LQFLESKKKDSYVLAEDKKLTNSHAEEITRRQAISRLGWAGIGVVAAVVVAGGGYLAYKEVYAPPSGPTGVKIGAVLDLSGPFASFGQGLKFGHTQAIADLNAQGGININGRTVPITYVVYDDASDPTKASSLTTQLILSDKVDILVHGVGPPTTTNPISVAAERGNVPFILGSPFEPWWAGGPYEYCWSILFRIATEPPGFPKGYTAADNYAGLTDQYRNQLNGNAGVLASGDTDGTGWYGLFPGVLKNDGYNVISPLLFPEGTTDFSSTINTWKNAPCDILWGNLPAPDYGTFWRQCSELGYRPKIAVIGRAPLFYADINAWSGNLPLGVVTEVWWDPAWNFKGIGSTTSQSLASAWATQTGTPLNRAIGFGYSAVQVAADSISRAGTLDKTSVNTAIGQTNGNFMTGPVKFLATHDSPCPMTLAQWQPGTGSEPNWVQPIVYSMVSQYPTTGNVIFPLPPWS